MGKIPITKIIRETYAYFFENFTTLLGLTWLPAVLVSILLYSVAIFPGLDVALFTLAIDLVLISIMGVAVARQVLGMRSGRVLVHFSFGRSEWQLFRAFFRVGALLFTAIVVTALLIPILGPVAWTVMILGAIAVVTIFVRCVFFLPLAAVLSRDQWLRRSYDLSAENSGEIFTIFLAASLPSLVLNLIANTLESASDSTPFRWSTSVADLRAALNQIVSTSPWDAILQLSLGAISSFLFWSLTVSGAGIAYRTFHPITTDTSEVFA